MRALSVTRVLPTPDAPQSGVFVERRLAAMAEQMPLRVLQPVPYFPGLNPLPSWARSGANTATALPVTPIPMFYLPRILKWLDSHWMYRACWRSQDFHVAGQPAQIIDAHFGYPDGVAATRLASALGLPCVVTIRGVEQDYLASGPDGSPIARQLTAMLQTATGCICVSHSLRDVVVAAGANPAAVTVIHNAIDSSMFAPGAAHAASAELGLGPDDVWIVSVGNLLSVKRHDVLLEAFAAVARTDMRLRLAIIGGASHEADTPTLLKQLTTRLGVENRVRFLGRIPPTTIVHWLRAARLFALASRREGCCNAILEALACGLPVAATDVGDNRYFVHPGKNGALAKPNDVVAMTAALRDGLRPLEWDRDRISAELPVGQWRDVAGAVDAFFGECQSRFRPSPTV